MSTSKAENLILGFYPSFNSLSGELIEMSSLRQENSILKKRITELSIRGRRENYDKDATIRQQKKQIQKLQQEVNALKIAYSETPSR